MMGEDAYPLRLNHRGVHIGMTSRLKRQAPLLLALAKAHPHVCRVILRGSHSVSFRVCTEHSQRERNPETCRES